MQILHYQPVSQLGKIRGQRSGFTLVMTVIVMAMVLMTVAGYLSTTRSDRITSSSHAAYVRSKMMAETGLTAAISLLHENARTGNYITAMPAPSPSPAPRYLEIYRPTDPEDYLRLDNAVGVAAVSQAVAAGSQQEQIPPPPPATPITTGTTPFALPVLTFSATNSYNFNQIVRVGGQDNGRIINPDGVPVYGQWVDVKNADDKLIGRYAFFVEDESMKLNIDVAGNNLGGGSSPVKRVNDLELPVPTPTPQSQIQEIDPSVVITGTTSNADAIQAIAKAGDPGKRVPTAATAALLDEWKKSFKDYAHLLTVHSKDDLTTARGWLRMDVNKLVSDAGEDQAKKKAAAEEIANWIRDAWTGFTPIDKLQYHQLYGDDRLRKQIAANIVDYIDEDNVPTDLGDIRLGKEDVPVIGIERIPYLFSVDIIYHASNVTKNDAPTPSTATVKMKIQFRFINLFERDLSLSPTEKDDLKDLQIATIKIGGIPALNKEGKVVFEVPPDKQPFELSVKEDLKPVNGAEDDTTVPAGQNGVVKSGARTFVTKDWLHEYSATFLITKNNKGEENDARPIFEADKLNIELFDAEGRRLDVIKAVVNSNPTGYLRPESGSYSTGDFLKDSRETAAIPLTYGSAGGTDLQYGDPRFRPKLVNDRWRHLNRSDEQRVKDATDSLAIGTSAEALIRSYAFDWYDHQANRPFAFHRNGALLSIGELGNICTAEYPWRTVYLQHPERPESTGQAGPKTEIPLRRRDSQDHVLLDLFRTSQDNTRKGAININSQYGTKARTPLTSLFIGVPVGSTHLTGTAAATLADGTLKKRLPEDTAPLNYQPDDNKPARPFFQIGDLASVVSRRISLSAANQTTGSPARSKIIHTVLPKSGQNNPIDAQRDTQVEQAFRKVSGSITTRGNTFRILYVGQVVNDLDNDGQITANEIGGEYLGEAFVERESLFEKKSPPNEVEREETVDSVYRIVAQRSVTE